ncbi:putative Diguanylate cyclase domain protein [Magnetospirillum sp. XM-1]|uniref:GGDEF domain-containing protein n=1 Tax=Magnetospirillum sp. XM-1 TaxID=1663591 RepID=UPI00073DE28B|nr:GGDEF domain-containing protein [Magnetospirillum sp. XM-1]CUW39821.1 putative Diguanylate cyclase domain protein [Magnetospirillum sp. XM-1]
MISTSLRVRFSLTFALSIMVGSGLLSYAIGSRSSEGVRAEIGRNLSEVTHQIADKLDRGMWARSGEVALLSTLVETQTTLDPKAVRVSLDRLKHSIPYFAWIGFTDPQGRVLAATGGILDGVDISKRPVFAEGVKGVFVGDVHEAVVLAKLLPNPSGEPMKFVDISRAVYGRDGTMLGVVASHLSWEWAREIEQSVLTPFDASQEVEVFVVATDDTVLLGPSSQIGHPLKLRSIARARQGDGNWQVETWPDGREYLTGYALARGYKDYGGLGWTIVARQPTETAFAAVSALQRHVIWWGAGVALACAAFGWLVASRVSAPLRRIALAADRLRGGEPVDIPAEKGVLEIQSLSTSLRALIDSLTRSEAARSHAEVQASHDRLTGLTNRLGLEDLLGRMLASARRSQSSLVVLCLDLDGFKGVNDTLGHGIGDLLLQEVAVRLRACARQGDITARLGGDEFMMVLSAPSHAAAADAMVVGERIVHSLGEPFVLDGNPVKIGCSVGAALWPLHGDDIGDVTRLADEALYAAKRGGKNRVVLHAEG